MNTAQLQNIVILSTMAEAMVSVIEQHGGNDFAAPQIETVAADAAAMLNAELGGK